MLLALAQLAEPARALRGLLTDAGVTGRQHFATGLRAAEWRARALRMFAELLAKVGLSNEVRLADLSNLAAAARTWVRATSASQSARLGHCSATRRRRSQR